MEKRVICVIGAGNVFICPDVLASLATYFGERPLEIRLYDPNEEFLLLHNELASVLFKFYKSNHDLFGYVTQNDLYKDADGVIVMPSFMPPANAPELISTGLPEDKIITLKEACDSFPEPSRKLPNFPDFEPIQWPALQTLRWINGEEYPIELVKRNSDSPIKRWLNNYSVSEL